MWRVQGQPGGCRKRGESPALGAALLVPLPSSGRMMRATLNKRHPPGECQHLGAASCSWRQELVRSSCNMMSCRAAWLELSSLLGSGSRHVSGFPVSVSACSSKWPGEVDVFPKKCLPSKYTSLDPGQVT